MNKQEFLEKLKQAQYWEEEFVLKYDTEDIWELLRSTGDEKFLRIKELWEQNLKETRKHKEMISKMIEKVGS